MGILIHFDFGTLECDLQKKQSICRHGRPEAFKVKKKLWRLQDMPQGHVLEPTAYFSFVWIQNDPSKNFLVILFVYWKFGDFSQGR